MDEVRKQALTIPKDVQLVLKMLRNTVGDLAKLKSYEQKNSRMKQKMRSNV